LPNAADYQRVAHRRPGDFEALAEIAKAEGCLHHRVALGDDDDNEVILIDEWPDKQAYDRFTLNPAVLDILQGLALDEDPPETDYYRAIPDPGEF
jgi:quinol monooxygenase YgiN